MKTALTIVAGLLTGVLVAVGVLAAFVFAGPDPVGLRPTPSPTVTASPIPSPSAAASPTLAPSASVGVSAAPSPLPSPSPSVAPQPSSSPPTPSSAPSGQTAGRAETASGHGGSGGGPRADEDDSGGIRAT